MPGITLRDEKILWQGNVFDWDCFLENMNLLKLPSHKKDRIKKLICISKENYELGNHSFFSESLPLNEHWRAFPDFSDKCCFLDIETTGLSRERNKITTIGLYDGKQSRVFVRGKDLNEFEKIIKDYSLIVTFNGRCFDLPFIKTVFPSLNLNHLHVDLRYALKEAGYTGGLKKIERSFGLSRDSEIGEVDGLEAVKLWHRYERIGDTRALDKLVAYNKADVENLKPLMEMAFECIKRKKLSNLMD